MSRAVSTSAHSRARTIASAISMKSRSRNSSGLGVPQKKKPSLGPPIFHRRMRRSTMKQTTSNLKRKFHGPSDLHVRSRRALQAANLVEFCPEGEAGAISLERAYRMAGGTCPDGGSPLMKPIAAVAGDRVEVTTYGIQVNGKLIPNSAAHFRDHRGRPLKPWPAGQYTVPTGKLWVISDFNSWSFDSRYFGPIPYSLVQHRLRPLWTFQTKVPEP